MKIIALYRQFPYLEGLWLSGCNGIYNMVQILLVNDSTHFYHLSGLLTLRKYGDIYVIVVYYYPF